MLKRLPLLILGLIVLAAVFGPLLLPWGHDVIDWDAVRVPPGSPGHLLGTDAVGRDLLARALAGTRIT
ncbi:MAG: ABC transporter permease, partial [Sphingomonadaceae bacterium]